MKIAIIGAGWIGIGCLKVLSQQGHEIDVFEKNNDLGGVWHPDNNYAGLRIHAPACTIAYSDFPLPSHINPLERITSAQVFSYLKDFCMHFNLYNRMSFSRRIISINYDSNTRKSKLIIADENNKTFIKDGYDYVIYTHGITERVIPRFKGRNEFLGQIYHSFDVSEKLLQELVLANKQISVLGGSKTATDFILKFNEYGYNVNWLCRTPYWFLRYDLLIKWSKKHHYYLTKFMWTLGGLYYRYMPKTFFWLWIKFHILHTYGKSPFNHKKFHLGIIDDHQMAILKQYYQLHAIEGDIVALEENAILLKNGKKVPTDVLICCTGSAATGSLLEVYVDDKKVNLEKIKFMYRDRVIPEVPNLIFTAFATFSPHSIKGITEGNWISKYLEMRSDTEDLIKHANCHEFNFFSLNPLFDSSRSNWIQLLTFYDPFLQSKEISKRQLIKYFCDVFFNPFSIKPLEFELPKIKKQNSSLFKKFTNWISRNKG
ncbi:FAD-dependent oxidoreductase [Legionella brunensis]|uniref:Flavin containing monooxygenae n=1 Tax=Legionella brunensis TaxID=29422 RepID=A0A0W0SL89_9GAMM|nr:FAD-dependent oxidoreductase [Legionella brunensis]KTC84033.1 Flavin containing monooxygenae [Legionella brunensis]